MLIFTNKDSVNSYTTMETLAYTSEKTNNSAVMFEQEGIMDVSRVDDTGNTPLFEARVKNDRQTSPRAYVHPERGVYGLEVPGEKFADESYKYSSHNAAQNRDKLKRTARNAQHSPLVTFAKDGVAYYAGIDSPYSIVVLTGEAGETAVATQLQGESEARTGVYLPNAGDRIYIVETALADHMAANPADENKIHSEILLADASSFAVFEVSDEFALNMAYNAKSAGKSNAEKLAKKRTARTDSNAYTGATPRVVETEGAPDNSASQSDTESQSSSDSSDDAAAYNIYDPNALVGSEMPILDTIIVEDEPKPAADTAAQPDAAPAAPDDSADTDTPQAPDAPAPRGATPRFDKSAKYANAHEAYDATQQELARTVAARTKLGMFARKKTRESLDAEIATQAEAYARAAAVFDTIQMEKWVSNGVVDTWRAKEPSLTDEQIDARLAQKLANYHTAKQRLHNLHTQHEFREKKGKFGKLSDWNDQASEWYAGLGKKEKIAVGIGSAVVGGALGLIAAPLGVIGGAGLVGAKVYKASLQARSGLYEGPKVVETLKATDGGRTKSTYDIQQEAATRMEQLRRDRVENADKTNKKARRVALASAALLGAGVVSHLDVVRDATETVREGIGSWWNDIMTPDTPVDTSDARPADGATAPGSGATTGPETGAPVGPPAPAEAAPPAPKPMEFSAAARTVVSGEGFYNTFAEMGITNPAEQASLLQKVGPELVARGVAYPMADGTYGISRPGAFSQDVLELIQKSR